LALLPGAAPARAQQIYSASASFGYAAEADAIWVGAPSKYRYGVGVRAGVSIPKLYLGAAFVQYTGFTDRARGPDSSYDSTHRTTLFGPEIGYDAAIGSHLLLRPYFGGGVLFEYGRTTVQGITVNDDHFRVHLTPGLLFAAQVSALTFGVDLRVVVSPLGAPVKWAPGAFATVGVRF
jgi:hypothetical protein